MKPAHNIILLALTAGSMVTTSHADFTSIDVNGGFNGVALDLGVADISGSNSTDETFIFGVGLEDYPLGISNTIQSTLGVTGSGSALVDVAFNSPTHISTTGSMTGSANTFGVQGDAQGGANGGVFFGFTLDEGAQIQMDWLLSDSMNNDANDLGRLKLYSMGVMGPVLFEVSQDGNGSDMMGTELFNLAAGHYVLFAASEVIVFADQGSGLVDATSGFDVDFTIVPAPSSALLLGPGILMLRRRR